MDTSFLFQNCYTGTDFENLMVQFLGEHGFRAKKTGMMKYLWRVHIVGASV